MKKKQVNKITLSAMLLALALVLPFMTGQIQYIGSMLCPMHIPVILCGYICGAPWGMIIGLIAPIMRSMIFGMPPMFPQAICMAFELAVYGFTAGAFYRMLHKTKLNIYVSLIISMILGRIVWGLAMFVCLGFDLGKFGIMAFLTGAVIEAFPGIILQIILIPLIVMLLKKYKHIS